MGSAWVMSEGCEEEAAEVLSEWTPHKCTKEAGRGGKGGIGKLLGQGGQEKQLH